MKRGIQLIPLIIFLFCHLPTYGLGATAPDKVTAHPALDYFAAPSSDGRYLAFVSERSGNPDIWLKSLATGIISLPRQLTTHPAVDRDPALTANGTKLLYISHKTDPRGDVYLLDLVTGEETQLTDLRSGDSTPQWGSEGQSIFYLKKDLKSGNQSVYRRMLGTEEGQEVVMSLVSVPGSVFKGKVTYIYPYLEKKTRTVQVRMEFENHDALFEFPQEN